MVRLKKPQLSTSAAFLHSGPDTLQNSFEFALAPSGQSGFYRQPMPIKELFLESLMSVIDGTMALVPHAQPPHELLSKTKLIAHRGAVRDAAPSLGLKENTLMAFERAIKVGAWGLEFDVRFTSDDIPVIHHDRSTRRLFGDDFIIEDTDFETLRNNRPEIATLTEFVAQFRSRAHLMLEIKRSPRPLDGRRLQNLAHCLDGLNAGQDFHLMSLDPKLLLVCEFAPKSAMLPVAQFNPGEMSRVALSEKMAGLTGQYVLIDDKTVRKHHEAGQMVGTGFIHSRSVLFREVGRGMDWIFTNHVAHVVDHYLNPPGM